VGRCARTNPRATRRARVRPLGLPRGGLTPSDIARKGREARPQGRGAEKPPIAIPPHRRIHRRIRAEAPLLERVTEIAKTRNWLPRHNFGTRNALFWNAPLEGRDSATRVVCLKTINPNESQLDRVSMKPTTKNQEYVPLDCPCGENHDGVECATCGEVGCPDDFKWHERTQSHLCEGHFEGACEDPRYSGFDRD